MLYVQVDHLLPLVPRMVPQMGPDDKQLHDFRERGPLPLPAGDQSPDVP